MRRSALRPARVLKGTRAVVLRVAMGEFPAGATVEQPARLAEKLVFEGFATYPETKPNVSVGSNDSGNGSGRARR